MTVNSPIDQAQISKTPVCPAAQALPLIARKIVKDLPPFLAGESVPQSGIPI